MCYLLRSHGLVPSSAASSRKMSRSRPGEGPAAHLRAAMSSSAPSMPRPQPRGSGCKHPRRLGICCNLMDCRPTQSRRVGDHYEVKVDGEWTPVPNDRINNVVAPDGGAHVCAPPQEGINKGVLFCVVLPPEI